MATRQELEAEYRRLAKRADQRLVRLEAYQHDRGFKTATKWAYARAIKDIQLYSGEEAKRFNTKPPKSTAQLEAKIADIKHFLDSTTSTKAGIIKVYKKRADTINEKFGTSFTWQDLAEYYLSGTADKLDSKYGSETALKSIAEIQSNEVEIVKAIKEKREVNLTIEDDIIADTVDKMLKDNNLDLNMLF